MWQKVTGDVFILQSCLSLDCYGVRNRQYKVITIRNKYTRYRRRGSNYNIVDTDGHIYQVDNLWFKGDFNRSNDYVALTIGNTYKVKGYGYRIGLLNAYQKIYAFEEV